MRPRTMSDRDCNLVEFKRLQHREWECGNRVEARTGWEPWPEGMTVWRIKPDGTEERIGVSYMRLPDEAGCAVYGGQCEC